MNGCISNMHVQSKSIPTTCNVMDKLLHVQTVCSNPMQLCTHSKLVLDFTLIWNVTFVLYLCTSTCNETIQFCSYVVEVITTMLNAMSYMSYIVAPQYISLLYSETMSELTLLTIDNSKHICDSNRQCSTFNLQEPWQVKWKQGRN